MITTDKGPRRVNAQFIYTSPTSPKPHQLPTCVKDDAERPATAEQATTKQATSLYRLTLIEEYCSADTYQKAKRQPATLPALLLPATITKHVIQTKSATPGVDHVTCLIMLRNDKTSSIPTTKLPIGATLTKHRDDSAGKPQWITRDKAQTSGTCYASVTAKAQANGGIVIYRPGTASNLGILGGTTITDARQPTWYVQHMPLEWDSDEM